MKVFYLGNYAGPDSPLGYCPNAAYIQNALEALGHTVTGVNECDVTADDLIAQVKGYDLLLTEEARLKGDNQNAGAHDIIDGRFQRVMDEVKVPVIPWLTNIFWSITRREEHITKNPIFKAKIVFTTDGGHDEEWRRAGVNHRLLRQGIHEPEAVLGKATYPTKAKVAFVGGVYENIWPYRRVLIDFLHETYKEDFLHTGKRGEVRHQELNDLLATVPVIVGDSVYSPRYWSNRVYEFIGRGGFLIMPRIPGLEKEFEPGKHIVFYRLGDFADLQKKIDYYLAHPKERERIRLAGFEHCRKKYTYKKRVQELLYVLKDEGIIA